MEPALAIALAVAVGVVALLGVALYLLLRQHGLLLLRFDELSGRFSRLEAALVPSAPPQPGLEPLPVGAEAPAFVLPGLDGRERRFPDDFAKPLVVLFFNPDCGFCSEMAPALGEAPDGASVLLVSRGDPAENARLAREHDWRCDVVLEPGWQIATQYGTQATPTGYLVGADGRIASPLAIGADALLQLIHAPGPGANGKAGGVRLRDVSESRLVRDGLPAGTPAPAFDLPDLNGERRTLADFRGRRVLLVFSDPACAPCQQLTPSLTRLHAQHEENGLQVLMVSRGDLEANREKAREHGVMFPVLLQRSREIAKSYGIFATPVGYVIDADGTLETDVAIGADAILRLVPA